MANILNAPHRIHFFTGLITATATLIWWAVFFLLPDMAGPAALSPLMVHPLMMALGLFGALIFGFLMTTYPRWMDTPPITGEFYIPSALLQGVGLLLCLAGTLVSAHWAVAGLLIHSLGWAWGISALLRVTMQAQRVALHVWGTLPALMVALLTELFAAALIILGKQDALWQVARIWILGGLLPIFMSVCHRMIPFFSRSAVPGYVFYRPEWAFWLQLAAVAILVVGEILDAALLRGAAGGVLAIISLHLSLKWQPWRCRKPMLLASLHIGYAWLPLAMWLIAFNALNGLLVLDAGMHALSLGYFTSLLIAMVTRVTQGHSGRSLVMPSMVTGLFWAAQLAAMLRVAASLAQTPAGLLSQLALLIVAVVMMLFAARNVPIYLRPRVDGKSG